jgi:hypothetical protein
MRIDTHRPVDCCAVVYDQFANLVAARQAVGIPDIFWVWAFWILTFLLFVCAIWSIKSRPGGGKISAGCLALVTVIWVPVAALTLVKVYAAYFYQVLHHHCPWCLFLPEHKFVGIPLFGALVIVTFEGPLSYLSANIAENYPSLRKKAGGRARLAGVRLLMAAVAYSGMISLPALWWRLLYGVWLGQ